MSARTWGFKSPLAHRVDLRVTTDVFNVGVTAKGYEKRRALA
ncbi:MAG TPA: hypothetical protein VEH29_14935 [Acidimicrobiales bacterium]|nr:hypothetical protein [Acidimicrobiales bacterium]